MIPTAAASKTTNEPIPGYKLVKRIGAGGYGEVWAAEAPGELVKAIKFVYGLLDEDRAARELKALNRIKGVRHPFLLSLERIEVVEGQLLIVTELADASLKDRFEQCRKAQQPGITRDELLGHLRDAADALDYMSEQHSLQHLDVKPENMLLVGGRIKVADFGLVKDIHEHTASMMGGLTPVYAPPEVFEGRPTRKSDQYSLAIVYQEMLTAVLPFPGRTAAQLAAQHLNAKPRLSSLPENDQAVIARALSKKPVDRFASCRELIDALAEAGKRSPGQPAAVKESPAASEIAGSTATRLPSEMFSNLDAATRAVQQLALGGGTLHATQAPAGEPKPIRTHTQRPPSCTEARTITGVAPELSALESSPALVDVPPPEGDPQAAPLRPTLFVGLGGTGGKVLRRLRRRLDDRLPPELRMLAPMLLLDTDARELANAAHDDGGSNLRPEEILALPLRRSQDYREDSRKILEWLSRRWLYNIPRSLQTEGLRPLGRLAFVDHSQDVTARLKQAIQQLYQEATRLQLQPRIVIIASPCGGSGGGMVTDISFLARQLLEETQPDSCLEIAAILIHSTNRNLQQQELAAANTVATLTELAQFHRPGAVFPGDPACGLKSRPAGSGGLQTAYLIHAGDELTPAEMDAAADRVAEFLMLDSITVVGNLLGAARREESETPGLNLRSFGLYEFGFTHDRLLDDSVHRICQRVVQRLGGPIQTPEQKKPSLLSGAAPNAEPAVDPLADLDQRAATLVRTMGLDAEPLIQVVQQFAAADLGGDPEAFFRRLMVAPAPGQPLPIEKWVAAACDLFGRQHSDTSINALPGELAQAMDKRVGPWIAQVGTGLREWIEAIVDDPQCRVIGAKRAAKWFQSYLKGLVDKLGETRGRFLRECQLVVNVLAGTDPQAKGKTVRRSPQELAMAFLQYCRLRLFELAAQRAGQIAHSLQSHAVAAHDAMVDLQRDLDHVAAQFPVVEAAAPTADVSAMRSSVADQLKAAEPTLAKQLEDQLTQELFAKLGGMRSVVTTGGDTRQQLLTILRTGARHAALAKVQSIDLASLLLAGTSADSPLNRCLTDAQPWLQRCGGRRRLLFVIPQQLMGQYNPATLAAQLGSTVFKQQPGVAPGASSDLVLLFELGDVSVPHAAAHILAFRRDLAEAASRLQTRCDVTWTPLFAF